MWPNSEITDLRKALDIKPIATFFQKNLLKFWDGELKLKNLLVEQIYPKEDQYHIKYRLNFKKPTPLVGNQLILYGQIANYYRSEDILAQSAVDGENIIYHPDLKMLVPVFPFDSKLTTLEKAFSPTYMLKFFQEKLPLEATSNAEIVDCKIQVLGYRLERRCTLLYELNLKTKPSQPKTIRLIGKIYSEKKSKEAWEIMTKLGESQLFQKNKNIKIHSLIFFSPELNALFLEYNPGKSLYRFKDSVSYLKVIKQIPVVLEQLQESKINLETKYTLADELELVDKSHRYLKLFLPEAREKADLILQKIEAESEKLQNSALLPAHRDFYDKQILIHGKTLTIIDWDTFAMADPGLDFGNFTAHLKLRGLQIPSFAPVFNKAEKLLEEKISASKYKEIGGNYKFYKLTALFRLASLYAFKPLWKNLGARLLKSWEMELLP